MAPTHQVLCSDAPYLQGNICQIKRLMMQIEHVLLANQLQVAKKEVVETARENLIIGPE